MGCDNTVRFLRCLKCMKIYDIIATKCEVCNITDTLDIQFSMRWFYTKDMPPECFEQEKSSILVYQEPNNLDVVNRCSS